MSRGEPPEPDLPNYLLEPLQKQSPEKLEVVAEYASELAVWKRQQREAELEDRRAEEEIDEEDREELQERDISTDPSDYEDVPSSGAYITVKETKPGYHYYYFQWREGDSWKNEYIAPVNPKQG
jgi:hypothetical protein